MKKIYFIKIAKTAVCAFFVPVFAFMSISCPVIGPFESIPLEVRLSIKNEKGLLSEEELKNFEVKLYQNGKELIEYPGNFMQGKKPFSIKRNRWGTGGELVLSYLFYKENIRQSKKRDTERLKKINNFRETLKECGFEISDTKGVYKPFIMKPLDNSFRDYFKSLSFTKVYYTIRLEKQ